MQQIEQHGVYRAIKCRQCSEAARGTRDCIQYGRNTKCYDCVRLGIPCSLLKEDDGVHRRNPRREVRVDPPVSFSLYLYILFEGDS